MNLITLIRKFLNLYFLAFIIFLFSAIYITYPLIFNLSNGVTSYGDQLLHGYVFKWVIHALFTNPQNLFTGTFYYPYLNPIAYSDVFITSALISVPLLKVFNSPIALVNFTLISSIFMVGFFTFLLTFYLTKNFLASLISGLILIFSPAFLDKEVHIQILSIQWIPLSILMFLVFVKNFKARYLFFALLFFDLQMYNSFLPGYFLFLFYSVFLIFIFLFDKKKFKRIFNRKNLLLIIICLMFLIPLVKPYFDVYNEYSAARNIRDTIHFALQPEDLIYPNQQTRLQGLLVNISNLKKYPRYDEVKYGYIGLVFSVVSILLIYKYIKRFKRKDYIYNSFVITGISSLILSFGPLLHINRETIHFPFPIVLPYALFYYLIPGFKGFRNSERWEIMFIFCFAVAIGILLTKFIKPKKIVFLFLILGIVLEFNFPMKVYPLKEVKDFPKIYSWLNTTPNDSVYIQMPIYNWNVPNSVVELEREYYSTLAFRKTVNGYSGFSPAKWQENALYLFYNFPNQESIVKIKKMNVDYVIVNKLEYDNLYKQKALTITGEEVLSKLKKDENLLFLKQMDSDYIFKFKK